MQTKQLDKTQTLDSQERPLWRQTTKEGTWHWRTELRSLEQQQLQRPGVKNCHGGGCDRDNAPFPPPSFLLLFPLFFFHISSLLILFPLSSLTHHYTHSHWFNRSVYTIHSSELPSLKGFLQLPDISAYLVPPLSSLSKTVVIFPPALNLWHLSYLCFELIALFCILVEKQVTRDLQHASIMST